MSKSLTHTRSDRALDRFLELNQLSQQLGIVHQVIEDERFRGDRVRLNGADVVNFGLCSYLGLGDDPRLVEAAKDALDRYGNSYSTSVAYTSLPLYNELKERFRAILEADVVIAGTTTLAHHAALPVVVRPGDTVLVDGLAHASLLSVMPNLEMNGAAVKQIGHNDLETVADFAETAEKPVWFVIDGLYSMHGDTAPAETIAEMLDSYEHLWVYCDDAHGLGWSGKNGRGQFLERAGWHERLVMSYGLAKSWGSMGGVVATQNKDLIEAIQVTGGPMVFGGPLPPAVLAASIASADIHLSPELEELQADLMSRIRFVNEYSSRKGIDIPIKEDTPLWFAEIGESMVTISLAAEMLNRGQFINPAVFPVVPRGRGGVRFTVTRYLSIEDIQGMLDVLKELVVERIGEVVIDLDAMENQPQD